MAPLIARIRSLLLWIALLFPALCQAQGYEISGESSLTGSFTLTLYDGDVVYIQSREAEVFYTGGLIKGGVYPIPRDYDLDVMGAIATAGGTVGASAGSSQSNISGKVGSLLPASRILVLREIDGRQYAIQIRQRDMLRDPSQRILIEPNDVILVEYTTFELWFNMLYNTINFTVRYSDFK